MPALTDARWTRLRAGLLCAASALAVSAGGSHGGSSGGSYQGNADCWGGEFTFARCCNKNLGEQGDVRCWDAEHTFEICRCANPDDMAGVKLPPTGGGGGGTGRGDGSPTTGGGGGEKHHAALACGTNGEPAADSKQVFALFAFVSAVCVDQLGEYAPKGEAAALPLSCKTPGCAHVVDLLAASCAPGGRWADPFLGAAFGPMLSPLVALCKSSDLWDHQLSEYAITSKREDDDPLLMAEIPSGGLPAYIIDGADDDGGAADCDTCDLNLLGVQQCKKACTAAVPAAAATAGNACDTDASNPTFGEAAGAYEGCAAHAFCNRDFTDGHRSVCQACSDCAPKDPRGTTLDTMAVLAPPGQEVRVTVEALYLPPHAELRLFPTGQAGELDGGPNVTLAGQGLPGSGSAADAVVSHGGRLVVQLRSDRRDAGAPATFRLKLEPACTTAVGACSGHGTCAKGVCECDCRAPGADGDPQCYDGEACQWAPER
jgi:hypothetical protein